MAIKNRRVVYPNLQFSSKDPTETELFYFDWTSKLQGGETISTVSIIATVLSGTDPNPQNIVSGNPTVTGGVIKQTLIGGVAGVVYLLTVTITTNLNSNYPAMVVKLPVANG